MEGRGEDSARGSLLGRALASDWIPSGLFFVVIGLVALWLSRDYAVGTLNRMGPGYFPRMLSLGMIALGVLIAAQGVRNLLAEGGGPSRVHVNRSVVLIPLALVAFSLTVERIGLVAALALALVIAAFADRQSRPLEVGLWIAGLITLLVLIFVVVLKLPLRLWPEF